MFKNLLFLLFGISLAVLTYGQRQPEHIRVDSSEIKFWLDSYKKILKKKPLLFLSLDSSKAIKPTGLIPSRESYMKLLNVKSRPDWSIGVEMALPVFLPGVVNYDALTGSEYLQGDYEYTKTLASLGFSTGLNFQYFFFGKDKKENPFIETDNFDLTVRKFYNAPNYFSLLSGLQYQIDYYNFVQLNHLVLSYYNTLIRTELQKIAIPLVARYHINLNARPKSVNNIGAININKPAVSKNALFLGLGVHLSYIFSADRFFRYTNSDDQSMLVALFADAINWTASDNARFPYPQTIIQKRGFRNLQLDAFVEFGYRVRINSKTSLPQYLNIALAYKFPFISYYYHSRGADTESIDNREIFTVGYRDLTGIQRIGSIQLSLGFELQHHKITDRYNK